MPVDSFKFLPRLISVIYEMTELQPEYPIPWTPLQHPLAESKFVLITSGGLYNKIDEPPFDLEREKQEPSWGDPSFRTIPNSINKGDFGVSHLHYNPEFVLEDINVLLPIHRFMELASRNRIRASADCAYSFMGYQGYPPDTSIWQETFGPEVAKRLKADGVDCVLLTPS
jgi:D-proline reductase (dithiol) PrdB